MSYRLDRRGRDRARGGASAAVAVQSVQTLAEMTVLKRNNGRGNKLDPLEGRKKSSEREFVGGTLTE